MSDFFNTVNVKTPDSKCSGSFTRGTYRGHHHRQQPCIFRAGLRDDILQYQG